MNKMKRTNWEWEVSRIACHNMAQRVLDLDVSDVQISEELEKRVQALFAKERIASRGRTIRRRVAVVLVAAVVLALTACACIPSVREKLYKLVVTYYDEYFSWSSVPESDGEETTDTRDVKLEKRLPKYLPTGFVLHRDDSTAQVTHVYYCNNDDESIIYYEQSVIGIKEFVVDSEKSIIQEVFINNYKGIVGFLTIDGHEQITLIWSDGVNDYLIETTLSLAEAIRIAESIG